MALSNGRLFYTRMEQFQRCPLAYKNSYITPIQQVPNPIMVDGNIAHRFMELVWRMDREEAIAQIVTEFGMYDRVITIVKDVWPSIDKVQWDKVKATEKWINYTLGAFTIVGKIDRLDDDFTITDYKYGNKEYTAGDIDNSLQASIYTTAIMREFNVNEVKFQYHNLRQHTIVSKIIKKNDARESFVQALARSISIAESKVGTDKENEAFSGKPGAGCSYCVFRQNCAPYALWMNQKLELDGNSSLEDAVSLFVDISAKVGIHLRLSDELNKHLISKVLSSPDPVLKVGKYEITYDGVKARVKESV